MAGQKGDRAETVEFVEVLDGLRVVGVQTRAGDPWVWSSPGITDT